MRFLDEASFSLASEALRGKTARFGERKDVGRCTGKESDRDRPSMIIKKLYGTALHNMVVVVAWYTTKTEWKRAERSV